MAIATATALSLGLGAAGLGMQFAGMRKATKAEARAAAQREVIAGLQAKDIRERGQREAELILASARSMRSTQMAQMAASGVVIGDGSSRVMLEMTEALAQADALVALRDARETAKQVKAGAAYDTAAAQSRSSATRTQAYANLLSGGASLFNTYHRAQTSKFNPNAASINS